MTKKREELNDAQPTVADVDPEATAWYWVLTTPITIHRDAMMIMEDPQCEFIPVFRDRDEAGGFLIKLGPPQVDNYRPEAMHLIDIRKFAVERHVMLIILDSQGHILERWAQVQ